MLAESLHYLTTPCSSSVRRMGYLREAIAIRARYRRCREAWQPHLQYSQQAIMEAAGRCHRSRTALILGAGELYDIPLAALCRQFTRVILVDIVFLHSARWQAYRQGAECHALDVTGMVDILHNSDDIPAIPAPRRFLKDEAVDLVVSGNLLSQLPILPVRYLMRRGTDAESLTQWGREIMQAHLAYLQAFHATVCLITDTAFMTSRASDGAVIAETDALQKISLPVSPVASSWIWEVAPAPEVDAQYNIQHRVSAMIL